MTRQGEFPLWCLTSIHEVEFNPWPCSVGRGSGIAVSRDVGCRCSLDPMLLWLWDRPAATALILPLVWELPNAVDGNHLPDLRGGGSVPCPLRSILLAQALIVSGLGIHAAASESLGLSAQGGCLLSGHPLTSAQIPKWDPFSTPW